MFLLCFRMFLKYHLAIIQWIPTFPICYDVPYTQFQLKTVKTPTTTQKRSPKIYNPRATTKVSYRSFNKKYRVLKMIDCVALVNGDVKHSKERELLYRFHISFRNEINFDSLLAWRVFKKLKYKISTIKQQQSKNKLTVVPEPNVSSWQGTDNLNFCEIF